MIHGFGAIRAVELAGEDGLIFYAEGESLTAKNNVVKALYQAITNASPVWLLECVPSYDSLMIQFDMLLVDYHQVYGFISQLPTGQESDEKAGCLHRLPVWYGAPVANDLALISQVTGLEQENIIELHQRLTYQVFAVGFAPGFAYLGELDESLSTPRLANPRKAVPKGAVAIADRQTAVYPDESPGGWHLLGLCPVQLYAPTNTDSPTLLKAGDSVEFYAISQHEYEQWSKQHEGAD